MTSGDLNSVINASGSFQKQVITDVADGNLIPGASPYIDSVTLSGSVLDDGTHPSLLENFQSQMAIGDTPAFILAAQIICLILFFLSLMSGTLVERQQQAIAVMRSRGASKWQIMGSLTTQGLGLCLLSALAGPILAALLVPLVALLVLPPDGRDAITILARDPWQTMSTLGAYCLVAAGVTLLTMILSLFFAVRATTLTQRREEAFRQSKRSRWREGVEKTTITVSLRPPFQMASLLLLKMTLENDHA